MVSVERWGTERPSSATSTYGDTGSDRSRRRPGHRAGEDSGPGGLASRAVVTDPPALPLGVRPQAGVGVDRAGVADQRQHAEVVEGVGVRRAASQVEAFPGGERLDRLRL